MEKAFIFRKEKIASFQKWRNKLVHSQKNELPDGLYQKCDKCGQLLESEKFRENALTCYHCGHHTPISAAARIQLWSDPFSFVEHDAKLASRNPLNFPGYTEKVREYQEKTQSLDAVICGEATIDEHRVILCVMDNRFMMGSMGSVVGEKITRSIELATRKELPLIISCTSGGARMQEGILSLMQMAKTSAALARHSEKNLLYIAVLTHPTTGGVTASFAMLGDIILAEPDALIGFAGKRVIEQTIRQTLPEDFQSSTFQLEHGFIDAIVERTAQKKKLATLLALHKKVQL